MVWIVGAGEPWGQELAVRILLGARPNGFLCLGNHRCYRYRMEPYVSAVALALRKGTRPNLRTVAGRAFKGHIEALQQDLGPLPDAAWPILREAGLVEVELRRLAGLPPTRETSGRQGYLRQQAKMLRNQLGQMAVSRNGHPSLADLATLATATTPPRAATTSGLEGDFSVGARVSIPPRLDPPSILDVMGSPNLFGRQFSQPSWDAWRVVLAALFALDMTDDQLALYQQHTGRGQPPTTPSREGWLVVGRRGGKSRIAALVAVFLAAFREYPLAPGEKGTVMLLASDRRQARVLMRYVCGLLESVPMLTAMVLRRTQETLELSNGIVIEIHTASLTSIRGYTVVAAVCDECAFWRTEDNAANPDVEIVAALRPAMATVPGALLLGISSPYARRGVLWQQYERHYGRDAASALVWHAPSMTMNPKLDPAIVGAAYESDPTSAEAEYGAKFRDLIGAWTSETALRACVLGQGDDVAPLDHVVYACDPATGAGDDSFTAAKAGVTVQADGTPLVVLDALFEARPPFRPSAIVDEIAAHIRSDGGHVVHGDGFAKNFVGELFQRAGIRYEIAPLSRSEAYLAFLTLVHSQAVRIPNDPRLLGQLAALQRSPMSGGRERVDHPTGQHDDLANACALACVLAHRMAGRPRYRVY